MSWISDQLSHGDCAMTTRVLIPLVAAALPWCAVGGRATAQPLTPSVHVRIAPVFKDPVSGVAWIAMKAECQRIWLAEGVAITWDAQDPHGPLPDLQVPLVVHDLELRKYAQAHADAFGVTVFAGRTQRVLVSVPRIRDMVSTRGRLIDRGELFALQKASLQSVQGFAGCGDAQSAAVHGDGAG